MRDRVYIRFGRREYPLLPTFAAHDKFEDRCGALTAHLISLTQGTATLRQRATLVYLGMHAAAEADGQKTDGYSVENTMKSMWDAGAADNDLMLKEVEFIERLLYTPEQYQAKKTAREEAERAQKMMEDLLGASSAFSDLPQESSDGPLPSSGDQPPENSSPV